MGNTWTGVSDQVLEEAESKMLSYSGIPIDQFEKTNVVIDSNNNYRSKPKIVIVHGYGGSGIIFYKIMKALADKFHCIYIDIIGMGASSRPKFECKTADEGDEYFVNFIEQWRIAFGDIKDFFLAGHSFGGYVCGQYAYRYPQNIKKLLMLSPVGVPLVEEQTLVEEEKKLTEKEKKKDKKQKKEKKNGPPKFVRSIAKSAWKNKWSPFGMMRKSGSCFAKKLIKKYMNRRMGSLPQEEFDDLLIYMHQIFMRDGSSEYAIFVCFRLGMYAWNPLETSNRLGNKDFPIPVSFFYGDRDWMDVRAGRRVVEANMFNNTLSSVYVVHDSDHHLYLDNPNEFAQVIIHDVENTLEREYLIEKVRTEYFETKKDITDSDDQPQSERSFEAKAEQDNIKV